MIRVTESFSLDEWKEIGDKYKKISEELSLLHLTLSKRYGKSSEQCKSLHRARYNFTKSCDFLEKEMFLEFQKDEIKYNENKHDKVFHPMNVVLTNY